MNLGGDGVHACDKAVRGDDSTAGGVVSISVVCVVVEGGSIGQSTACDLDTVYVDGDGVIVSVVNREVVEDRGIRNGYCRAKVGRGVLLGAALVRVGIDEIYFGCFVAVSVAKLRWARAPASVVEVARSPGGSLIATIVEVFPRRATS